MFFEILDTNPLPFPYSEPNVLSSGHDLMCRSQLHNRSILHLLLLLLLRSCP